MLTKIKRIKCPKCGGSPDSFLELYRDHGISFYMEDGKLEREGILEPGEPYKVEALCGTCGHQWRLRGVMQITDLILEGESC